MLSAATLTFILTEGRDGSVFMEMFVEVILENTFSMVKGMQTASKPSHDFHVFFL